MKHYKGDGAVFLVIGFCLGLFLGVVFNILSYGLSIGIMLGSLIDLSFYIRYKKINNK
ncbi:hypothetical protein B4123_0612 [Bacillus paralicheniformis]|uniref:Glycine zipper-like domain-containing protein n=1 Tax=Bacillus paralicheniformis TaxID=1648923 RepID=A0ABY3FV59_9BACI|nr:hypothetical protein SC10_B2orf05535 [Bacillus paralicheniformis]ETB71624.1 hypothetical protein A943_09850 [Bacillus sp. CPSM8]KUL13775.1 hypothetical protein LI7559_05155 [Bacillus licheniformis LMG 7559]KUL17766.1 hypothetical protein LI6934_08565 [Bacillus licheniformis LMG 6934]GIN76234.1 hypothetical protein J41TS8_12750 [Bacillus sp. J41TS8]